MHDKVIIADGRNTEVGSLTTRAADRVNSENVLVVWDDPVVAQRYLQHWQSRWSKGTDWNSSYYTALNDPLRIAPTRVTFIKSVADLKTVVSSANNHVNA
jgi:phosphatidylserine/phosphatidylglycerophosphate/cardiolipin synthase-like enzyme